MLYLYTEFMYNQSIRLEYEQLTQFTVIGQPTITHPGMLCLLW